LQGNFLHRQTKAWKRKKKKEPFFSHVFTGFQNKNQKKKKGEGIKRSLPVSEVGLAHRGKKKKKKFARGGGGGV